MVKAKKAAAKKANGSVHHGHKGHSAETHGEATKAAKPLTIEERLTALESKVQKLSKSHEAHAQALKDTGIVRS